ncbi:hypothetical protein MFLAVUS_000804 [Mucor flavus]|uniref:Uncharacterized protein n=1 Tax=Mucor flavus TaxID=439312 RepID=A0ABP9YKR0_9FUNG
MEGVDNFEQFKILLNSIVSETITAMDNLQHTIIVPNNTRRTRTETTALEKINFSSLCNRLKAHLVHIPQDIDRFGGGPHTESETCEQQHKFMRELLCHTNRQNGGRDIAVRFAEEYMLRHIGEGGYFANPSTSALEMCGASVQAAFDSILIQSELELLDNNSSRKKLAVGLAGLFKSDSSSKPSKLVLGVIVQKINDNFVAEAYDFIPINNNPVSIYDSCQKDIAASPGNFEIQVQPAKQLLSGNDVIYSQQPLSFNPPSTSTAPRLVPAPPSLYAEPSSPRPVATRETTAIDESRTSGWKRKQEESYVLLLRELQKKLINMDELQKKISKMEEQETLMSKILDL